MEFRSLDANDRMGFAGASDTALINDDQQAVVVIVDATGFSDEHKVEVFLGYEDDQPETYMIVMEDRPSAVLLAKSVCLLSEILCYNIRPILATMVAEGLGGSQIGV